MMLSLSESVSMTSSRRFVLDVVGCIRDCAQVMPAAGVGVWRS